MKKPILLIIIISGFLMGASYSNTTVKKHLKKCIKGYENVNLRTSLEKHFKIKITPERQKNICKCSLNELQKQLTEKQFLHYSKKVLTENEKHFLQTWIRKCYTKYRNDNESNIEV
tara:strand:+ start:113 stop:460 length:348 start_codon:yes stop_codon:yes gene_type:complete